MLIYINDPKILFIINYILVCNHTNVWMQLKLNTIFIIKIQIISQITKKNSM